MLVAHTTYVRGEEGATCNTRDKYSEVVFLGEVSYDSLKAKAIHGSLKAPPIAYEFEERRSVTKLRG